MTGSFYLCSECHLRVSAGMHTLASMMSLPFWGRKVVCSVHESSRAITWQGSPITPDPGLVIEVYESDFTTRAPRGHAQLSRGACACPAPQHHMIHNLPAKKSRSKTKQSVVTLAYHDPFRWPAFQPTGLLNQAAALPRTTL